MNQTSKRFAAYLATLAFAGSVAWTFRQPASPAAGHRSVKNLVVDGNPEQTMEVGRQLLGELRAHNWDWQAVDSRYKWAPDQEFYQFAPNGRGYWTWGHDERSEYADEVAFYSTLYTWYDFEPIPGIEGRLHVSGFIIVAWKDGRVERVPMEDVRLYPVEGRKSIMVFPGMKEYDPNLPTWGQPASGRSVAGKFKS